MIILTGYIYLEPKYVNEFHADIKTLMKSTKDVKGCLFYNTSIDDAEAGRMLVVERWEDQASLSNHFERKEIAEFLEKWGDKIEGDIQKYDASNERSLTD